ncbi:MAG: energy transducer TonB [Bacteroidota bacterium]
MKAITLFLASFVFVYSLAGQQASPKAEDKFYMLDENFKGTTQQKATYFIHVEKENDTCWQFDTYHIMGPIISSEQYKDEKGQLANGHFSYYNKKGAIDSTGNYINGLQDGSWYFINDTGRYYLQKDYKAGLIVATKDFLKLDSIEKAKNDTAKKNPEKIEIESLFPGGIKKWISYLSENMVYPDRALKNNIQGKVVIQFIVDKDGIVISPEIALSVEYSLDQEALRLIKASPAWAPAEQNGKKVKSYKKQPISFKFK